MFNHPQMHCPKRVRVYWLQVSLSQVVFPGIYGCRRDLDLSWAASDLPYNAFLDSLGERLNMVAYVLLEPCHLPGNGFLMGSWDS